MGKQVAKKTTHTKKAAPVEVTPEPVAIDSATVAMKKANDVKIKKHLKAMNAQVLAKVDLKQVISAAKALKAFAKKQSDNEIAKALLNDED